ncbi:MAG: cytochrome c3 family protein, partial [Chitinophagales bacterium]
SRPGGAATAGAGRRAPGARPETGTAGRVDPARSAPGRRVLRFTRGGRPAPRALPARGRPGLPSLSLAVHRAHAARLRQSRLRPVCYNCHPGVATQCNRGAMFARGYLCDDRRCHGSMEQVARSLAEGRKPWQSEPKCGGCHGRRYAQNPGAMYKDSVLMNSPAPEMNGKILCGACHNASHAEWKSTQPVDNLVPRQVLGYDSYVRRCDVCHPLRRGRAHGSGRI